MPENLDSDDSDYVKVSFIDKLMSRPITYYIVISSGNPWYKLWCGLDILCCLVSSYMYAYIAVFKNEIGYAKVGTTTLCDLVFFFELIFMLSILFKFFLEFKLEEEPLPIRNLKRIAVRYIKSQEFLRDFIPIIPLAHLVQL